MARSDKVKSTAKGLYFRNIGYSETGSPRKFYLGTDESTAAITCERLEMLWQLVKDSTGKKVWTANALALADAIRKRQDVLVAESDRARIRFPAIDDTLWLCVFGDAVQVDVVEPLTPEERKAMLDASRQQKREEARALVLFPNQPTLTGQGLHDAIRSYIAETIARPKYRNEQDELTAWGKGKSRQARYLMSMVEDIDLSD